MRTNTKHQPIYDLLDLTQLELDILTAGLSLVRRHYRDKLRAGNLTVEDADRYTNYIEGAAGLGDAIEG